MSIKRINSFVIATLGVVLLSVAFAGTAQAEQCSADGKICLVTDTSQPLVTPTTLLFRVTSEADHFNGRLVQQGPGDTNLWESEIRPVTTDGVEAFEAIAFNATVDYKATFAIPVLASVANIQAKFIRTKKHFVAVFSYEGRVTVDTILQFSLGINPDVVGKHLASKRKRVTRPPGPQVIRMAISRRTAFKRCRQYRYCKLHIDPVSMLIPTYYDPGTNGNTPRQRYMSIQIPVNLMGARVIKDTRRLCRKLQERKKQHTRLYRKRCPIPPDDGQRTAADIKKQKEKKEREEEKNRP